MMHHRSVETAIRVRRAARCRWRIA